MEKLKKGRTRRRRKMYILLLETRELTFLSLVLISFKVEKLKGEKRRRRERWARHIHTSTKD